MMQKKHREILRSGSGQHPEIGVAHGRAIRSDVTQNPLYRADQILAVSAFIGINGTKVKDFIRRPKPKRVQALVWAVTSPRPTVLNLPTFGKES